MVKEKILEVLKRYKNGILQNELLKILGISKSYLSELLNELEFRGYIIRKRIKRDYLIYLREYFEEERKKYLKIGFIKALEYMYLVPIIKELKRDYNVVLKTYNNGIEVLKGLVNNNIDLAIAPLPTVILFSIIYKGILKPLSLGSIGGSYFITKAGFNLREAEKIRLGTTPLSSMEQFSMRILEMKGIDINKLEIHYYTSASKIVEDFKSGTLDVISIWMPYNIELKNVKEYDYSEVFEIPCCIFVTRATLSDKDMDKIMNSIESLDEKYIIKNKKELMVKFLRISGIDIKQYKNFDIKIIKDINFEKLCNIVIPIKSVKKYII